MDDYIKRSDAQDMVHLYAITVDKTDTLGSVLRNIIRDIPPADVRSVVYCRDCKFSYDSVGGRCCSHGVCVDCIVQDDFYCADGERSEGGTP